MLLLSGTASARADLVPSPGQVDFGYQAVGTTSQPKTTTFRNTGDQPLTVVAVAPATDVYARTGGTCGATPFTIAAQASCTIEHTFRPTSATWFPQTLAVTLAGGTSVNFGLFGTGEVGYLEISPPWYTFFSTPAGTIGGTMRATMNNIRPVSLMVLQMTANSVPPGSFVRTGGTCPQPPFEVGAFGGCMVEYTFVPQAVGSASMDLYILASSGTFALLASGEGTPEIPLFEDGFEAPAAAPTQ